MPCQKLCFTSPYPMNIVGARLEKVPGTSAVFTGTDQSSNHIPARQVSKLRNFSEKLHGERLEMTCQHRDVCFGEGSCKPIGRRELGRPAGLPGLGISAKVVSFHSSGQRGPSDSHPCFVTRLATIPISSPSAFHITAGAI